MPLPSLTSTFNLGTLLSLLIELDGDCKRVTEFIADVERAGLASIEKACNVEASQSMKLYFSLLFFAVATPPQFITFLGFIKAHAERLPFVCHCC